MEGARLSRRVGLSFAGPARSRGGSGAGPSREPRRNQEQGDGASWAQKVGQERSKSVRERSAIYIYFFF